MLLGDSPLFDHLDHHNSLQGLGETEVYKRKVCVHFQAEIISGHVARFHTNPGHSVITSVQ